MITNVCPRCHSEKVSIHDNGYYGCSDCGKAGKSYSLYLRIKDEESSEDIYVRNIIREMAGVLSEQSGPQIAAGLARVLEEYKVEVTPIVAREILSSVIAETFQTLYRLIIPFFPENLQKDINVLTSTIQKSQSEESARVSEEKSSEQGGNDASRS